MSHTTHQSGTHQTGPAHPTQPLRVEAILGNTSDESWQRQLASATVDVLALDQWEAQKSRLRRTTEDGQEVTLSLERGAQLRDGDVLAWDEPSATAVVARIDLKDVLEVDLAGVLGQAPETVVQTCLELGHALGNQHWPAVVKGTKVYVPLTVDKAVMGSVMRTHAFEGVSHSFLPGAEVIPYLAPHEARRLFGAAAREGEGHTHDPLA
ncbi:urease accessory protein UreE [Rhodococcus sp. X156]|uniref:urease accessory protein UreE n=1 Tax=Rhodococcus sp. X156 TaxID=2499145 RepID=UPI0019D1DEAF|nr:urease accessory protein UreE [Rhodococcus sp. X156]